MTASPKAIRYHQQTKKYDDEQGQTGHLDVLEKSRSRGITRRQKTNGKHTEHVTIYIYIYICVYMYVCVYIYIYSALQKYWNSKDTIALLDDESRHLQI